jgi:hypothetical protein
VVFVVFIALKLTLVLQQVQIRVSDQGNTGIGYPCPVSENIEVPTNLMFAYCTSKLPVVVLEQESPIIMYMKAVNNPPQIHLFDQAGVDQYAVQAIPVSQNVTTFLWKMAVTDVDIGETAGCKIKVNIQTGRYLLGVELLFFYLG